MNREAVAISKTDPTPKLDVEHLKNGLEKPPLLPVSLTNFLDFVAAKDSSQRLTVARQIVKQIATPYDPRSDMYKRLREAIQASGGQKFEINLDKLSETKRRHYRPTLDGWNTFVGNKKFQAVPVKRKNWIGENLLIRVNPETALLRDNRRLYLKLFFKVNQLRKSQVGIVYQMMHEMLVDEPSEDIGVLHLRKGKLVAPPNSLPDSETAVSLRAEAAYLRRLLGGYLG
ncbi:MAG: hypothetical protein WD273_12255 [Trueperaceae bacterium]